MTEPPRDPLWVPFVDRLPVDGVAVSTIGGLQAPEALGASDGTSARLDEIQFDLGEGPCWDAAAQRRWVTAPDLFRPAETRWPAFREALSDSPVRAVWAVPLAVGGIHVGTVDMWAGKPGDLSTADRAVATDLGRTAARAVLRSALADLDIPWEEDEGPRPRAVVHQATGMVMAQLGGDVSEALLVLQGRAFAEGRPVREVAQDVVDRRLDFAAESGDDPR